MGVIEDVYGDLDADISLEEFRDAVEEKVEQMGGLADEETAAMLIAHEQGDDEVNNVADIEPGIEEAKFVAKVTSVGDVRTFDRDTDDEEEEDAEGYVLNADVADETGSVRITFWNEQARSAAEELEAGQVLRIAGRPKEGYSGVEVNVDKAEPDHDTEIDVQLQDTYNVEDLSLGLSDVNLQGKVLDTDDIRTFSRDDGSEGRVANLTLGDPTGRIRVTLWDEQADAAEEFSAGVSVEVVDGYVRERNGDLELHVGNRGAVEEIEEDIQYVPESADIDGLSIGDTVDLAGVVRSADPKREFDRDDGSKGQVRNIRVQDSTGDIRVALWGAKADKDIAPGDEVQLTDIEIQDGWQDDIEGSAGWQSTVSVLAESDGAADADGETDASETGLDAFSGSSDGAGEAKQNGDADSAPAESSGEHTEFTGTVVQAGNPVVLDNGEETVSVETDADVTLGQEVTARGALRDGRLDADDVF